PPPPTLFPYTTLFRSTLLGQHILNNEMRSYNGPTGAAFVQSTYQLDPVHQSDDRCVAIPPFSFSSTLPADPCVGCPSVDSGIWRSEEHTSELQSPCNL